MTRFSSCAPRKWTEFGHQLWYFYPVIGAFLFSVCIANASGSAEIQNGTVLNGTATKFDSNVARKGVDFADTAKAVKNVVLFAKKKGRNEKSEKSKLSSGSNGVKVENGGFAAEWEYQLASLLPQDVSTLPPKSVSSPLKANTGFPSQRIGPGTWHQGSTGSWWLFGGHQPGGGNEKKASSLLYRAPHYLTDLWRYSPTTAKWTLIYRPEISSGNISTQVPSERVTSIPENISFPLLCGRESSGDDKLLVFAGNGVVSQNNFSKVESLPISSSGQGIIWLYSNQEGTWTSYSCPSQNGSKACPQFAKPALSWCDASGLTILEPTKPSHSENVINDTTENANIDITYYNQWNFNLATSTWTNFASLNISTSVQNLLQTGNCRSIPTTNSTNHLVYFLCPSANIPLLNRNVILYNPATASFTLLGDIHLNNAFTDKKIWQPARSSLAAVFLPEKNISLIFLAYHKLLDIWIHNHATDKLHFIENVWKADTLHVFQTHEHFYQLQVSFEGLSSPVLVIPMLNPRNKLASFQNSPATTIFKVTIVSDKEVFLPPRDAPLLLLNDNAVVEEQVESTTTVYQTNELYTNKTIKIVSKSSVENGNSSSKSNDQVFTPSVVVARTTTAASTTSTSTTTAFSTRMPNQQKPLRLMMMPMMKQKSGSGVVGSGGSGGGSNKMVMSLGKRAKSSVAPITSRLPRLSTSSEVPSKFVSVSSTTPDYSNVSNDQTEILPAPQKLHNDSKVAEEVVVVTQKPGVISSRSTSSNVNLEAQGYQNDDQYHNFRSPGRLDLNAGEGQNNVVLWHENQQQRHEQEEEPGTQNIDPKIFFALTLSFFGSIGLITFVRRCVKCPIGRLEEDPCILDKESLTPPVRYTVIPGDMPYHTPIV